MSLSQLLQNQAKKLKIIEKKEKKFVKKSFCTNSEDYVEMLKNTSFENISEIIDPFTFKSITISFNDEEIKKLRELNLKFLDFKNQKMEEMKKILFKYYEKIEDLELKKKIKELIIGSKKFHLEGIFSIFFSKIFFEIYNIEKIEELKKLSEKIENSILNSSERNKKIGVFIRLSTLSPKNAILYFGKEMLEMKKKFNSILKKIEDLTKNENSFINQSMYALYMTSVEMMKIKIDEKKEIGNMGGGKRFINYLIGFLN